MDPTTLGLLMVAGLILLLMLGFPIAFSLLGIGLASLIITQGWDATDYLVGNFPFAVTSEFGYIIIPLFLFMGEMAYVAGLSQRAFRVAKAWVGHLPGGLAMASVGACAGFAAVCGSSIVTAATIGRISIPEMLGAGYSQRLAGGAVATAGTLGVLIPPSSILVVYSIATQVPILDLFASALVPGILTALIYGVGIYLLVRFDPRERNATFLPRQPWSERIAALRNGWEILALFGIVMGSMLLGIATPTEAAAFGAVTALAIAFLRKTSLKTVRKGLISSGSSTASIFMLIVGAGVFSLALSTTQVPQQMAAYASSLDVPPAVLIVLLLVPYLFLGMFIDAISMILLTMPIVFPIVVQNNIDPVLFGILVTKMTEIGNITPPVGLNVFVVKGASSEIDINQVFLGIVPFFFMELLLIALLILFPEIALFPISGR